MIMNKKTKMIFICAVAAALILGIFAGIAISKSTGEETGPKDSVEEAGTDADTGTETGSDTDTEGKTGSDTYTELKTGSDADAEEKSGSENDKAGSSDGYILEYASNNSWKDGDITMYGIDWKISNASGEAIDGWELKLEIKGLAKAEGWNGDFKINGDTLTIKNVDYNGNIPAGADTGMGCNLGVKADELKVIQAELNGKECRIDKVKAIDPNAKNTDDKEKNTDDKAKNSDNKAGIKKNTDAKQGDDWLHTDGNRIYDKDGREVWLTGVNWFGYNTGTNTFDGLWNSSLEKTVKATADRGFNLIRVPMSAQILNEWSKGVYPEANYNRAYNEELNSMNSLEIFEYFLSLAEANGIKVLIDIHSAQTDASGHMANLWYTDKVSADEYLAALKWAANRYKDNDTIIAYDLKNEPHGKQDEGSRAAIWNDSKADNNWKYMAERAALTVLKENPNVLILVEGIEIYPVDIKANGDYHSKEAEDYHYNWWGGNLRGVRDFPVDLKEYNDKLVYSPHDYGPTVYEQPWFHEDYDYDSLMKECWRDNWFYIHEKKIAPLLIGEWGGFMREPNLKWMTCLRELIGKNRLNHTFWCLNANSGDTGGLLKDDFVTWDEEKYKFVKEVLWQENGKFVGLDHSIPLGENGMSISEIKK